MSESESDDFDIFGKPPELSVPEQKVLPDKPWHKARKHYVRIRQWCGQIQNLIASQKLEGKKLNYLCLPGADFLDIRTIAGVCRRGKVGLHYLGFDSSEHGQGTRARVSQNEIRSLDFVDPLSEVLPDRFENIAGRKSAAFKRVMRSAPFHVVNLDLCDSLLSPATGPRYLEALRELCAIQLQEGTKPWLLFVTTRAGRNESDPHLLTELFCRIRDNTASSAAFASKVSEIGLSSAMIEAESLGEPSVPPSHLVSAFALGLSKWLLTLLLAGEPRVKVEVTGALCYSVAASAPDMLCVAFLLTPQVRPGSVSPTDPAEFERATALELIPAISALPNVDDLLRADKELLEKTIRQSQSVLEQARYDTSGYRTQTYSELGLPPLPDSL